MALVRMLMIAAVVSLAGGMFCALIGGLVGYAFPSAGSVYYGAEKSGAAAREPGTNKVEFGVESQRNLAAQGAAIGGAIGLTLGALLGCAVGVLDQLALIVRGAITGRGSKTAPSTAPPGAPKAAHM